MNNLTSIENKVSQNNDVVNKQNRNSNDKSISGSVTHSGDATNSFDVEKWKRSHFPSFETTMLFHQAALLSLSPRQLDLLLKYTDTLRQQRISLQKQLECAFCKTNGRPQMWYTSHALKDWRGRVLCPELRAYTCPRCGASGDYAHTISYCPKPNDPGFWSYCNF